MKRERFLASMVVVAVVQTAAARVSFAQPQVVAPPSTDANAVAREHFRRGDQLTRERRYADALVEFEQGYALSQRPLFLFNMAECAKELGDVERARRLYTQYLEVDRTGTMSATATSRLAALPPPRVAGVSGASAQSSPTGGEPRQVQVTPVPDEQRTAHAPFRPVVDQRNMPTLDPPRDPQSPGGKTIFEDWPFWAVTAVVVVGGGIAIGIAASQNGTPAFSCVSNCADFRN